MRAMQVTTDGSLKEINTSERYLTNNFRRVNFYTFEMWMDMSSGYPENVLGTALLRSGIGPRGTVTGTIILTGGTDGAGHVLGLHAGLWNYLAGMAKRVF